MQMQMMLSQGQIQETDKEEIEPVKQPEIIKEWMACVSRMDKYGIAAEVGESYIEVVIPGFGRVRADNIRELNLIIDGFAGAVIMQYTE